MLAMHGMAGGEMVVRVPAFEQRAGLVRPLFIAKAVQVVAQVPGDVGECAQARGGVAHIATLVLAARARPGRGAWKCPGSRR